jgi:hypothetical protein
MMQAAPTLSTRSATSDIMLTVEALTNGLTQVDRHYGVLIINDQPDEGGQKK